MSSLLDGFFTGSRYKTKTNKQKLEQRIKDSVLNLVLDRDQSFLNTARKNKTNILVNNRDGGIQNIFVDGIRYVSFPSSMEDKLSEMSYYDAEYYLDEVMKLATVDLDDEKSKMYNESEMELLQNDIKDKYNHITGKSIDIDEQLFEYRESKTDSETDKELEDGKSEDDSGNELTTKGMQKSGAGYSESTIKSEGTEKNREYSFEDTDTNPDGMLNQIAEDNRFFNRDSNYMNEHREEHLKALAQQIVKSFQGRVSKKRTIVPSKKLVSKALVLDNYDKMYQNKKGNNGKHLNINLIIDMSGSMDGEPINNAIEIIYIFNEIALSGKLNGSVIWSESSSRCKSTFPMPREFIKKMSSTGGAEGLGKNLKNYIKELKSSDVNICMTDGQLCDDKILKSFYEKQNIDIIGVYVNKGAKDLTDYTGSLDRWFTKSLVRRTTDELCQKLIQLGLRKK